MDCQATPREGREKQKRGKRLLRPLSLLRHLGGLRKGTGTARLFARGQAPADGSQSPFVREAQEREVSLFRL